MTLKRSCGALLALSLIATGALAQETTPPAQTPAPATAPAEPAPTPAPAETPAPAAETAPAASPAATAAPVAATLGTPAEGKGQIVFYRPGKFVGAAVSFKVREGEVELGKLSNGGYFFVDVTPGAHEYVVHSETKDILPLEIDAGEVYYVEGLLGMGVMVGRPNLTPSDKAKFEAAGKMKLTKLKS
jgi:hypothetical protein